ncbi:DENN domain-containing protein 5B [Carex littledalei]|uniref:DENN domain-containing protein 5B n=1 Tax=Carex littledalei TaxID=544730 RepID=A0A833QK88_9POAL|nr:DENN domain-containing protein 5B [Carex littledalei]
MEEKVLEAGGDHDPPASTSSSSSSSSSQEEPTNDVTPSTTLESTDVAGSVDSIDVAGSVDSTDVAESRTPSKQPKESESPMMLRIATIKQQAKHMRSESFQKWRRQMQRAWRWGPAGGGGAGSNNNREQVARATVNFEAMANQKRMWYQMYSKSRNHRQLKEPTSLFEHLLVVGLHSCANVEAIEDAFVKRKAWENGVVKSDVLDLRNIQYHAAIPTLEPQILFKYPLGKNVGMRESDIPAFCFPEGVKARLIERTPSMSDLNEVVFGQEHLSRDDLCFIFQMKVSDNATMYGVCLHVQEIVQRAPGILGSVSPITHNSHKPSRYLVSAPRCYCLLTRLPFFELHYEMLNSIIAQERLDRITQYVTEVKLAEAIPHSFKDNNQSENLNSPQRSYSELMEYAIPVNSVSGLIYSPNRLSAKDTSPFLAKVPEPQSPESFSNSEASEVSNVKELDKETRPQFDDYASETSESRSDSFERISGVFENCHTSPDVTSAYNSTPSKRMERVESLECLARGIGSDEEDDDSISDEKIMGWAKANNNESLQIVCGYHSLPIPPHGGEIVFHPLDHLQLVKYCRPKLSQLGLGDLSSINYQHYLVDKNEVNSRLAAAEEAFALSIWTTATLCRVLSLESVLSLFAGALLEKQLVVICPNLGILSAVVLSVIPMIRPFEWQSLLLPVLPNKMFDLLDAPVPFIVGIQQKSADVKRKTANVIRIDVLKNQVKACSFPQLPRYKELFAELSPIHSRLSGENPIAQRHPVYRCNEMQVSLLLKDSFIDSFPIKDRPFIKLFIDTQLFSVLSDSRLALYEAEQT